MKNTEIKHIWSLVCNNSSVDINSNSLSLFNILEEITGEVEVPVENINKEINLPIRLEIVSLWSRNELGEDMFGEVKVEFLGPEKDIMQDFSYKLTIPKDKSRMRFRLNLVGLKIKGNGEYFFQIKINNKIVQEIPLAVNLKKKGVIQKSDLS